MGCDTTQLFKVCIRNVFQSTHPHGVRLDEPHSVINQFLFQSTHPHGVRQTPSKHRLQLYSVSIHAPTWGATYILVIGTRHIYTFQSTHPHGVRPSPYDSAPHIILFQSTHPHGVRLTKKSVKTDLWEFQSTHPHGVRRSTSSYTQPMKRFNPRTHMGCDFISGRMTVITSSVSIHAPTWGATTSSV